MNEKKHTPGPWKATHSDPSKGYDCFWITACPFSNGEKEVAVVSGGYPHDTHEANARLIAAAPELLDACIKTVEENLHLSDGDVCTLIHLKRAIAKAKGLPDPENESTSCTEAEQ